MASGSITVICGCCFFIFKYLFLFSGDATITKKPSPFFAGCLGTTLPPQASIAPKISNFKTILLIKNILFLKIKGCKHLICHLKCVLYIKNSVLHFIFPINSQNFYIYWLVNRPFFLIKNKFKVILISQPININEFSWFPTLKEITDYLSEHLQRY